MSVGRTGCCSVAPTLNHTTANLLLVTSTFDFTSTTTAAHHCFDGAPTWLRLSCLSAVD